MRGETREETALRAAAAGPREYCRKLRAEIRRNHLLAGHDPAGRASRLGRLIAHIEAHLFEESLSVGSACRAVGIADSAIAADLRAYTRYTVDQLIARLRIEAAIHLLLHTQVRVERIGHLVGYKIYRTFLKAYRNWTGETPDTARRSKPDTSAAFGTASLVALWRIGAGDLGADEVRALQEGLGELYPEVFSACDEPSAEAGPAPATPSLDAEALERVQAAELWPRLAGLPFAQQRKLVAGWTFWTPAPFLVLHQRSREEGRRDRKRGVEVAQLALDSLDGNESRLGSRIHALRAEGWSWLANAQRLDLDFGTAETSFRRAEGILDAHDLKEAWVAGLFHALKATLRMFERRHDEAFDAFDQALPPFEAAGDVHYQVRTLLQKIAALIQAGRFADTEPTVRKAEALLEAAPDEALGFQIAYMAVTALVQAGDFDPAERRLRVLGDQIRDIEDPVWRHQIRWADAKTDHGLGRLDAAEAGYLTCWRGFQAYDKQHHAALVALDLSLLYAERGETGRVLEIAPVVVKFFAGLRVYEDTLAALRLLEDAIAQEEVTANVLRELRSRLRQDPLASLRVGGKKAPLAATAFPGVVAPAADN